MGVCGRGIDSRRTLGAVESRIVVRKWRVLELLAQKKGGGIQN